MAPKGSRQKRKSVGSSSTLFNAGMMPLLRKAADAVGKNIDVPGKLWGNCPAADKNKLFNCAVLEYAPMHKWEEAMPVYVSSAYFCLVMGEKDGAQIDAGDQFWLKADNEFLKYYYSANPLAEDSAREEAPPADEAQDPPGVDTSTPDNKNTTIAFDYVTKVSSFSRGGKVVTIYSCNCVLDAVGLHPIKCSGKITWEDHLFIGSDGIMDEFAMITTLRNDFPLHFTLFRHSTAQHCTAHRSFIAHNGKTALHTSIITLFSGS